MERGRPRAADPGAALARQARGRACARAWRSRADARRVRSRRRRKRAGLFGPRGQDSRQAEGPRLRRLPQGRRRIGPRTAGREAFGGSPVPRARGNGGRGRGRGSRRDRALAREPFRPAFSAGGRVAGFRQIRARGEPHRARDPSHPPCLLARGAERSRERAPCPPRAAARGLADAAARDHRSPGRQGSRRRGPRRARSRSGERGRLHRHSRHRRRRGLR